ncbi:hypothetical protein [uncultured Prevotella sp.]|uniref:hypothetical protein n=1 Tax=uncultured Prevotella sp. TaxID=159272 RepID=UPI002594C467|nr:hypothetical protein [uncultured Prevotella sp.]
MTQKDLAEEYAIKARENAIYFKDGNFPDMSLYQEEDIKAAFNAGRESIVENVPKLKWKRVHKDGLYLAVTVFNWFYRIEFVYNEFHLFCNGYFISRYLSLLEAKQAANEHYKLKIKLALEL